MPVRRSSWSRLCWGFPLRRVEAPGAIAVRKPGCWELCGDGRALACYAGDVERSPGNHGTLSHHRKAEVTFGRSLLDVESFPIVRDSDLRSLPRPLERE